MNGQLQDRQETRRLDELVELSVPVKGSSFSEVHGIGLDRSLVLEPVWSEQSVYVVDHSIGCGVVATDDPRHIIYPQRFLFVAEPQGMS